MSDRIAAALGAQHPHRRHNPLTGQWVLVSPHRTQRPWQGKREAGAAASRPAHDPKCYLCPGNQRAGDAQNPDYQGTFVFDNDFAALRQDDGPPFDTGHALLEAQQVRGTCRVICFHASRHAGSSHAAPTLLLLSTYSRTRL